MVQFRKPSSMTYNYTPLQSVRTSIQTRLHALSTKRRIVYGCVGLLILFIFSFMIMGFPDGSSVSSVWTPKVDDTTLTPFPPMDDNSSDSDIGLGSEYPHEHSPQPPSSPPPSALSRPTSSYPDETHTAEGFPLIQTRNNGKVVLLTGAMGSGNFEEVPDFYAKVVSNRADYARAHGILPQQWIGF